MADQPWEIVERAFTLWQYDRDNRDRAMEAAAALIRHTAGGAEALQALVTTTVFAERAGGRGEDPETALAAALARSLYRRTPPAVADKAWTPFTIECNDCHRRQSAEVQGTGDEAAAAFREKMLTDGGWVETKSRRHLCPNCTPAALRRNP